MSVSHNRGGHHNSGHDAWWNNGWQNHHSQWGFGWWRDYGQRDSFRNAFCVWWLQTHRGDLNPTSVEITRFCVWQLGLYVGR